MKKILCFIFAMILSISFSCRFSYADENTINVGLVKYSNVSELNISIDGELSLSNDSNFYSINLGSKTFKLKPVATYIIKTNIGFDNIQVLDKEQNKFILKDDKFYYCYGEFSTEIQAKTFLTDNNLSGDIVKAESIIGLYVDNVLNMAFKNTLNIKSSDGFVSINNKKYRNTIQMTYKNNKLYTTNCLDIEQYLYGVVPSEMPSSWHKEALKAQAVACRNYAHSNKGTHSFEGFDVCDTVHCQVYNGVSSEKDNTTTAVNETKGVLAYYNNEPINAVFSSSSGGYTDDSENVWNEKIPYLRAVNDEFEEGYKQWTRTFTFDELSNLASIGEVTEITVENSAKTGRVTSIKLVGTNGQKVLEKEEIRSFFSKTSQGSLDSRNFKMAKGVVSGLTTSTSTSTKDDTSSQIYVVSSKNSTTIKKDDIFAIDKTNNKNNPSDIYAINQNQKITSVLQINNTTNNTNNNSVDFTYISKLSKKDSSSITFIGKGWGHGVGMSQYGANSLAKKGYTYDNILKYYYTGIDVR